MQSVHYQPDVKRRVQILTSVCMLSPLVPNYIKILSAYPGFLLADGYDEVNSSGAVDCYYEHFKKCSVTSSELDHMGQP